MSEDIRSFEEFWPYYVRAHSKPMTRWIHLAGTAGAAACVAAFVATRRPRWILAGLVAGYGPAWASHFFVEHNKPATFKYPLWSLLSDFKMAAMMLQGTMDAEVARVMQGEHDGATGNGASSDKSSATDQAAPVAVSGADRPN